MLILCLYNTSILLFMFFIESPCAKIPREPKIVDILESGDEEEVNSEEYLEE